MQELEASQVRAWRLEELRRLGYSLRQRAHLLDMIERGELQLEDVRKLTDEKHIPADTAWWLIS